MVVVMVGWPLSWLWQRWSWRIGTAKSGVHGAGVFLSSRRRSFLICFRLVARGELIQEVIAMVGTEENGIGGRRGRRSGVLIMVLMVPVSGVGFALLVLAARVRWSRMVSVLGF